MIEKMLSKENPMNVDELLVVTFTNASAAEMRHRISEALEKAINEDPTSTHLRKQIKFIKSSIDFNPSLLLFGSHSKILLFNRY